jgi:hypothetical protein
MLDSSKKKEKGGGRLNNQRSYSNANQKNLMDVFEYLAEDILTPKTIKEVQDAFDITYDQARRTLWNLCDRKWAEEIAGGYRITPRVVQISENMRRQTAEVLDRYLADNDINKKETPDGS